jgi:type IV pilus assembly protein PilX
MNPRQPSRRARAQRGATLLVVLVMLAVMLLGGLTYARIGLVNTQLAGNLANSESAAQATDVGVATAFDELKSMSNSDGDQGGWYFAMPRPPDADGLPTGIDWSAAREMQVGGYSVRYVVERFCRTTVVTDKVNQCQLSEVASDIRDAGSDVAIERPALQTYRVTVRAMGARNATSWVQALLLRK